MTLKNSLSGPFLVVVGVLGGPLAWLAHLLLSYGLIPIACILDSTLILHLITAVTAVLALLAGVAAWRYRSIINEQRATAEEPPGMNRFWAQVGIGSGLLFFAVILAEGLPNFFINPCTF